MDTFFKGNEHHAALMRNLGGNVNVKSPGQNVAVNIRRSTRDETLERAPRANTDEADERAYRACRTALDRKQAERAQGNRGTGKNAGAFHKLHAKVRDAIANGEMAKALPYKLGDYSIEQAYSDLRSVPLPSAADAFKSLRKTMAKTARSLGNTTLAKSLEAGYDSNSVTLTQGSTLRKQSLDKRLQSTVGGGDPKPVKPKLMTKSQCQAAALKGLNSGKLTASQCQHIDVSLSMDRRIDDATMATLRELQGGK